MVTAADLGILFVTGIMTGFFANMFMTAKKRMAHEDGQGRTVDDGSNPYRPILAVAAFGVFCIGIYLINLIGR